MDKADSAVEQRMTDLAEEEDGCGCDCCGGLNDAERALWEAALAKREVTVEAPPEPKMVARQSGC
jgi:hypothetical protein